MYALQNPQNVWTPPAAELPYYQLKSRQEVLTNQLETVTDVREDLARELQQGNRTGADKEGLEARIRTHDARIQQLDAELATVGRELAANAPASLTVPPIRTIHRGNSDEDMVAAGFVGAFIALALCVPFFIRSFRRRRNPAGVNTSQTPTLAAERVDRMEAAIDSIAVEIERVSENQRFMTRLMTETQLAGTIAAVRGSTEAAKMAAEKANNV